MCFNETIASGKDGETIFAVMVHDGICRRKECDVSSSYAKVFVESGVFGKNMQNLEEIIEFRSVIPFVSDSEQNL